jgi:DNA mismatch repair protein MutS
MTQQDHLTPAMRQWQRVKDAHPDKIVLFRMGDFFEMFGEDARRASEVLDIALTTRERGKPDPMPMCGIPVHALEAYLGRLIRSGHKVALCDQTEDPAKAKGLVRREVTRVVTPGTVLEEGVVEAAEPVLLAALNLSPRAAGLAWADLSSGDLAVWQSSKEEAEDRLRALSPAELLYPEGTEGELPAGSRALTPLPARAFRREGVEELLGRVFRLPPGLPGLPAEPEPLGALRALVEYARERGGEILRRPRYELPGTFLAMDEATRRNLELVASGEDGGRTGTLLACLDGSRTPMGARLLREWVLCPSAVMQEILGRQDAVQLWLDHAPELAAFREILEGFPDMGRLVARFGAAIGSPRDAGALRDALNRIPEAVQWAARAGQPLPETERSMPRLLIWRDRLNEELEGRLPPTAREGGIFARGVHEELDRLRDLGENAHGAILAMEAKEREATGISSLKVRYNKVFGYFLEVSKVHLAKVPPRYERRQTLVNAERYVTPELKELEARILSARADREALEAELWAGLVQALQPDLGMMRDVAQDLARADLLAGFAAIARERGYVRPAIVQEPRTSVEESRHPILELDPRHRPFVPNAIHLDTEEQQVILLTGPNMGGKSTYLRQTALLQVMAQIGSFVPALRAEIGLADRLFCRVGAGDSLLRGLSTFMVEMTETAGILLNATAQSLVVLDEVGRGTSTYDGLAIAWAVVEALRGPEGVGCRTLFATHYHELTELGRTLPGVVNRTMAVREYGGKVHFLRMVEEGSADRSYGIHVAELAGIPEKVVIRAREILDNLEARREAVGLSRPQPGPRQGRLFEEPGSGREAEVLAAILAAHPESMTPLQALMLLERLRRKLRP